MKPQTALIHDPKHPPQAIDTLQPPVYHASTIIFRDTDALQNRHWSDRYDYSYGTHGTPTVYTLADQIARLEGGEHCLLAPSGLSAIVLVNSAFLATGDEVWLPDNAYGPNRDHLDFLHKSYGIKVCIYDPLDVDSFQPSPSARLIWLEAAGSVTLEFPDLQGLIKKARSHDVLVALDNTWGAGLAFCPFDIGQEHLAVDISVHALTKYPSGGSDVLMGSVVTRDATLHKRLSWMHAKQGICVSGDDCARIYRSLPSMHLRYDQQSRSCLDLLNFLKNHPHITQVLHPADPDAAGHRFWQENCPSAKSASLVSVIFDRQFTWVDICRFVDALKLFKIGFSWGGATSLVMPYDLKKMRTRSQQHLCDGYLVRFCVGLEAGEDLIADIDGALSTGLR